MTSRLFVLSVLLVSLRTILYGAPNSESYYQAIAAKAFGGVTEVRMADGSRCDIVTEHYAIEVDFASKWKEAIGQSLNYAFQSSKSAGIVLIIKDKAGSLKLMSIIEHYALSITVWTISQESLEVVRLN